MCALCLPRATASRASLSAPLRRARQESRRVGSREVLSFRLSAAILAKAASGRRRSVSRVPRHFFGREASKEEDEEQPAVPAHCVRLVNNTETQLDVLAFPKDAMAFSFGGQVTKIPPLSHLDVTAKSRTCRLAIRRRDSAQMVVLPRGATLTLQQRQEEDSDSYHEAVLGDIAATFDAGTSWEILPGPLFWRLSRNVQDVEFQVAALLHAANARLSFKVVRELGSDWRSRPTARIRVVGAGFLGSNFLHKGTMYIAKITAPSAVEEITAAHRRISGTFGPPEQVLRFEGYVKTDTGAHILLFEDFGESLATIMSSNSETLTVRDKDQCAQDLMAALTALHSSGVYHLALSPESVRLRRDGMGTMRLKLADLGTAERASEPLPSSKPTLLGWQSYMAPEVRSRKGMQKLLARMASEPKKKAPKVPDSKLLGSVKNLEILPSLRKHRSKPPGGVKTGMDSQTQMKLLAEFPIFAELSPADLVQLAREFQGPFYVPAGATLFRANDMGDFLYFILAGEVVARRGKKELRRYTRGGFVGETALLGKRPTRRIFSAAAARGGGGCAVLRMHHTSFRKDFRSRGPVTGIVGPARWRFLEQPALGPDPEAVDSFSAGALWCQLAAGSKVISLSRIKRASTVEDLLAAVATRELGGFYFLLQEWRQVALIELMVRRASAYEALVCMEEQDKIVTEPAEDVEPPQGFLGSVGRTVTDIQKTALSAFELTQDAMAASVAVKMSNSARATVLNQWKKLTNVVTERYGQAVGEVFGTIYGNLFAKDLLWMFRNPTRAQRFPVLLVREAENGSLLARWQIGASMVFESELCARTLPRVLPSVKPAMQARGFSGV
ncbi:unnamed protein product [Effrenium voratum]|nr:unnamed protein product [Effrenium voratum]